MAPAAEVTGIYTLFGRAWQESGQSERRSCSTEAVRTCHCEERQARVPRESNPGFVPATHENRDCFAEFKRLVFSHLRTSVESAD